MRNSPVITVDPTKFGDADQDRVAAALDNASDGGLIDAGSLPDEVRGQLVFALTALVRGEQVTAVAKGKPLTTSEAADLLGMSRSHLSKLCKAGRVPSYLVGSATRIDSETVMHILRERGRVRSEAREAIESAEARRRARAARTAGID